MSAEAYAWARRQKLHGPVQKLVLLLMAGDASPDGFCVEVDTAARGEALAGEACLPILEFWRTVDALHKDGAIKPDAEAGVRGYRLALAREFTSSHRGAHA